MRSTPPMTPMASPKSAWRMPRRMHQRHEHLLSPLMPASYVILHNRDAACEAVFVPKPLEDQLCRMMLLLGSRLVVPENAVDHRNKWIELEFCRRLLVRNPAALRTSSSCSRSADQSRIAAPPPARSAPQSEPHAVPSNRDPRPSSLALCRIEGQKAICCRILLRRNRKARPLQRGIIAPALTPAWSRKASLKRWAPTGTQRTAG